MDIIMKIAKEELKYITNRVKEIKKKYDRIPGMKYVHNYAYRDLISCFKDEIDNDYVKTRSYHDAIYDPITSIYTERKYRIYRLLSIEIKKLLAAKVIDKAESMRVRRLAKGDKSSCDLAKVIINNYRNIRIKKERKKNARKA